MAKKLNDATFKFGGEEMHLNKSTKQAAVRLQRGARPPKRSARGLSNTELEGFRLLNAERGIDQKLDKMRAMPEVAVGTHVYEVPGCEGAPLVPTGILYIEFLEACLPSVQRQIIEKMHLNILEVVSEHAFRVTVTPKSGNPIKCTVALQKNKWVSVAEPEFVTRPAERDFSPPLGKFIETQWHHENTGKAIPIVDVNNAVFGASSFKKGADAKVRAAWQFLGGLGNKNIRIAVIDTGFDTNHPSLRGDGRKVRNPFNAATRQPECSPLFQYDDGSFGVYSHGTSCAAVAAGVLDLNGILGACPNAQIIPIKLDILSDTAIKNAFEHAVMNGADIISCSLGFPQPVPLSTYISNYLTKIAREGRSGRGLPIFFAAGNANPHSNWQPRQVSDFANHPEIICVAASNSLDQRSDYSFFGKNTFLCAPTNGEPGAGITTATVELAADGRSIRPIYTSGFGGTSSAAPLAAGVCALMLSANPDLTLTDIKNIIRKSCDKIGAASSYDANGHSQWVGYGRINALAAVKMADAMLSGNAQPTPTPSPAPVPTPKLRGQVSSKILNVRSGPATTFPKIRELKQGNTVELLSKVNDWWQIGKDQFVSALYIQILPIEKRGRVNFSFLNVRSGPGVGNAKVGELKQNEVVTIFETSADGWHRIGTGRWVLSKYITLI